MSGMLLIMKKPEELEQKKQSDPNIRAKIIIGNTR